MHVIGPIGPIVIYTYPVILNTVRRIISKAALTVWHVHSSHPPNWMQFSSVQRLWTRLKGAPQQIGLVTTCDMIRFQPTTHLKFQRSVRLPTHYDPTGSTTAALIFILHTVTRLLTTHPYIVVMALDFWQHAPHTAPYWFGYTRRPLGLQLAGFVLQWSFTLHKIRWGVVGPLRNFGWDNPRGPG